MAGNGADTEPWRQLSSSTLKKNTVVFPSQAQVSVGAYIKLLEEQGITGIISMQTTSRGQCRPTVESYEKAKLLVLNGLECKGERVSPCFVSAPTTQLHIHDAPIWISDGVLKEAPNSCAAQCKKGTSKICFLPRDSKNVVFHAETSCCSERSFLISRCSQLFQDVVLLVAGFCSCGCF